MLTDVRKLCGHVSTGPTGVITAPHEFVTLGGVGMVCASLIQGTVDEPAAGRVNVGGAILYVKTQSDEVPSQFV